jgi:hypothetical protein
MLALDEVCLNGSLVQMRLNDTVFDFAGWRIVQ